MPKFLQVTKLAARGASDDHIGTDAAALAFYTALSLPPLLVLLLWALGSFSTGAEEHLRREAALLVGPDGVALVNSILSHADRKVSLSALSGWIGLAALLFAASGVFSQLQRALNRIWGVRAQPGGGPKHWLRKRLLSLGLVGVLAFLMAVSLAASTLLRAAYDGNGDGVVVHVIDRVGTLAVFALLFAAVFKWLPDVVVSWNDVAGGALVTAVLFSISKYLTGFYLVKMELGSAYGAAGSAVVVLAWVYFSGFVLFIGAEITKAWLSVKGRRIQPNEHAVALVYRQVEPGVETAAQLGSDLSSK